MPSSISLSALSWSKPDGEPLFNNLSLSFGQIRTGIVGRNGAGKSTLLRLIAGELTPWSGTIALHGTVAMMRQDAMEKPSETIADLFGVTAALRLLERAEEGLASADELADADWTLAERLDAALQQVRLSCSAETPLGVLSGGQRSRAALAALVFAKPDFLLLDEPTNNLDRSGRDAVIDLIRRWKGGALIASHDRELLEEMDAIVELTGLGASSYGGNYSAFRARKEIELAAAHHHLGTAEKAKAEAARRAQEAAERKARRDSAGHKARAKGDQPKIMMDASKGRAEASGGAGARLREARREAVHDALEAARQKIEVLQPVHMDIPSTGLPQQRQVLRLTSVTGGYDATSPIIRDLSLSILGPERILVQGPNGSGKTTLLKLVTGQLAPQTGKVERLVPFAMLDQHVGLLDPKSSLRENFQRLNRTATVHAAHEALARFGFRAADALRITGTLSGGERLRAGLACTLAASPAPMLLILDEPTNHLDLNAIAELEAALSDYDGAMLVVSHDEAFVQSLSITHVVRLGG
ncbi:ABC-F family ATP-binding cassette domain-containing protein [Oryzifoliimicrobium ureilyticus]|uniref:ABC-F family ATP-binding cassette domain-containing protein n=1 Tax=Oryzifoliimicrobium ureilyticus TaxID=3113724 RepID=UPI00307674E2